MEASSQNFLAVLHISGGEGAGAVRKGCFLHPKDLNKSSRSYSGNALDKFLNLSKPDSPSLKRIYTLQICREN